MYIPYKIKLIDNIALHYNLNVARRKTIFNKITNRKIALIINFILLLYSFTIFFSFSPTLFFFLFFFLPFLLFFSFFLFFFSVLHYFFSFLLHYFLSFLFYNIFPCYCRWILTYEHADLFRTRHILLSSGPS